MWNRPISAVERTWVPPQSSREYSPSPISHHAHDVAVLLAEQRHRAQPRGLVQRGRDRAHGVVGERSTRSPGPRRRAAPRRLSAVAVAEVEAQLVGADVGAGLAHVGAEALAQRGVQQVGRGVVALGGVAGGVVHAREHRLLGSSVPCSSTTASAWSSPRRKTSSTRARQSPCSHSIMPTSETWPPPAA